ncbi:MAG: hypothetical protein LBO74_02080 [Candidatus Symbiothrix sp.]|jgi:hypothetical protein|nr:hypothetical protein [Candidatus Symbiothrix sp.]
MNKYLIIGILFLVAVSCATQKKSEQHLTSSNSSKETNELVTNQISQSEGTIFTGKNTNEVSESYIIRYDTSLPVDSLTGKPPVAEEEFRTTGKKTKEKTNVTNSTKKATNQTGKHTEENNNTVNEDQKTDISAEAAGGKHFVWTWITAVIVIGILIFLGIPKKK